MRDLHSNIKSVRVISSVAAGVTGTGTVGKIVDLAGYQGCEFVINYGTITATNATILPVIKEGSVTGTLTSVADADLLGTELLASITATTPRTSGVSKNVIKRVGYIGNKRYVNVTIVPTVTATTPVGVVAVLNKASNSPIAT